MGVTTVVYEGGMKFVGRGASGHPVVMDAATASGGSDQAARPVEVLLSSLGGCTGMDVISILGKMKTPVESLRITVDDDRAPDYPKAITRIRLTYHIVGRVPPENIERAIELSLSKYCPIANTLGGVAEITSEYRINEIA
ncbi:OsmC family protein [Candidatus Bipolaricaulota bacterium]|nr:OsmC family protein [Candidatus Bipolaricaulota bacterium]